MAGTATGTGHPSTSCIAIIGSFLQLDARNALKASRDRRVSALLWSASSSSRELKAEVRSGFQGFLTSASNHDGLSRLGLVTRSYGPALKYCGAIMWSSTWC